MKKNKYNIEMNNNNNISYLLSFILEHGDLFYEYFELEKNIPNNLYVYYKNGSFQLDLGDVLIKENNNTFTLKHSKNNIVRENIIMSEEELINFFVPLTYFLNKY